MPWKKLSVSYVILDFDGYGDEGQFKGTSAFNATDEPGTADGFELPDIRVTLKAADFETGAIAEITRTLTEAIEEMVSDFLEETHEGWEDGEGAFGNFRLSVPDRAITLEFYERFIETTFEESSF
ncbi:MAG: hypothetical protein KGH75_01665 [Rhodospirillales bacterium]|nr:hypothetical protein [Rhodospirillales bacterium]